MDELRIHDVASDLRRLMTYLMEDDGPSMNRRLEGLRHAHRVLEGMARDFDDPIDYHC